MEKRILISIFVIILAILIAGSIIFLKNTNIMNKIFFKEKNIPDRELLGDEENEEVKGDIEWLSNFESLGDLDLMKGIAAQYYKVGETKDKKAIVVARDEKGWTIARFIENESDFFYGYSYLGIHSDWDKKKMRIKADGHSFKDLSVPMNLRIKDIELVLTENHDFCQNKENKDIVEIATSKYGKVYSYSKLNDIWGDFGIRDRSYCLHFHDGTILAYQEYGDQFTLDYDGSLSIESYDFNDIGQEFKERIFGYLDCQYQGNRRQPENRSGLLLTGDLTRRFFVSFDCGVIRYYGPEKNLTAINDLRTYFIPDKEEILSELAYYIYVSTNNREELMTKEEFLGEYPVLLGKTDKGNYIPVFDKNLLNSFEKIGNSK